MNDNLLFSLINKYFFRLSSSYRWAFFFIVFASSAARAQLVVTNDSWKADPVAAEGWESLYFNDLNWSNALVVSSNCLPTVGFGAQGIWYNTGGQVLFFRKTFTLTGNPVSGQAQFSADAPFEFYVNGILAGTGGEGRRFYSFDIKSLLRCGANVFAIKMSNSSRCQVFSFRASMQAAAKSCCFAAIDPVFTSLPAVISQSKALDGKYFVPAGMVVQVTGENTLLDLTNVDIVFGECAGIRFSNGAKLRAGNSVFRACGESQAWLGFEFDHTQQNVIEACIFKNAARGLFFNRANGRVTNNQFHENRVGILISGAFFTEAISGNTFVWNDVQGDFELAACQPFKPVIAAGEYYGIYSLFSQHEGLISQNHFISGLRRSLNRNGIYMRRSSATISKNRFSNMESAIRLTANPRPCQLENNEIEVTLDVWQGDQVSVGATEAPVLIFNNQLVNTNASHNNSAAISAVQSAFLKIRQNSIKGFVAGIALSRVSRSLVADNKIEGSHRFGILTQECAQLDMGCNTIDMNFGAGIVNESIGIAGFRLSADSRIYSNCIRNCFNSVHLSGGKGKLPWIRNNFLYNYDGAGIYNNGFSGNIGVDLNDPGMNTLYSNHPSAVDINSAPTIGAANNFGMRQISGVTVTQQQELHSTASCAQQVGEVPSQSNARRFNLLCDTYETQLHPVMPKSGGFALQNGAKEVRVNSFSETLALQHALSGEEATTFHQTAKNSDALTQQEKTWLGWYLLLQQDPQKALESIESLPVSSDEDKKLKAVETMRLRFLLENQVFTETDGQHLGEIAKGSGRAAEVAADVLALSGESIAEKQVAMPKPDFAMLNNQPLIRLAEKHLEVYPNPAGSQLSFKMSAQAAKSCSVQVADVPGKTLYSMHLDAVAGVFLLDVAHLNAGVYVLTVVTPEGQRQQTRFVKQ